MLKLKVLVCKSWRCCIVFWGLSFFGRRKWLVLYLVSFIYCILDIFILFSVFVVRLMSCILLWVLMIFVIVCCLKIVLCCSSWLCWIVCVGYCKFLNIRKIFVFMFLMKRVWSCICMVGMCGVMVLKSLWLKKGFSWIWFIFWKKLMCYSIWNIWGLRWCWLIWNVFLWVLVVCRFVKICFVIGNIFLLKWSCFLCVLWWFLVVSWVVNLFW